MQQAHFTSMQEKKKCKQLEDRVLQKSLSPRKHPNSGLELRGLQQRAQELSEEGAAQKMQIEKLKVFLKDLHDSCKVGHKIELSACHDQQRKLELQHSYLFLTKQ